MEDEGDVPTAPILARFFSNIPLSRGGPTSLVIFDIHALQVCAFIWLAFQNVWFSSAFIYLFIYFVLKLLFICIYLLFFLILQERFYFGDNVLPCFESGIPLLKNRLQELPDSDNVSS